MSRTLLLLTLTLGTMAISALSLKAQEAPLPQPTPAGNKCAPRDKMVEQLSTRFSEVRQSIGMAGPAQVVETFADTETGSWTIIVTGATGLTCIVAAGRAYENLAEVLPSPGAPA